MGHANKWGIVYNTECKDFNDKISRAKDFVMDVLGKSAGSCFAKKFLLKKVKKNNKTVMPLALNEEIDERCFEEVDVAETFINYFSNEGEVISCSVEKKGTLQTFTYTLKLKLIVHK